MRSDHMKIRKLYPSTLLSILALLSLSSCLLQAKGTRNDSKDPQIGTIEFFSDMEGTQAIDLASPGQKIYMKVSTLRKYFKPGDRLRMVAGAGSDNLLEFEMKLTEDMDISAGESKIVPFLDDGDAVHERHMSKLVPWLAALSPGVHEIEVVPEQWIGPQSSKQNIGRFKIDLSQGVEPYQAMVETINKLRLAGNAAAIPQAKNHDKKLRKKVAAWLAKNDRDTHYYDFLLMNEDWVIQKNDLGVTIARSMKVYGFTRTGDGKCWIDKRPTLAQKHIASGKFQDKLYKFSSGLYRDEVQCSVLEGLEN